MVLCALTDSCCHWLQSWLDHPSHCSASAHQLPEAPHPPATWGLHFSHHCLNVCNLNSSCNGLLLISSESKRSRGCVSSDFYFCSFNCERHQITISQLSDATLGKQKAAEDSWELKGNVQLTWLLGGTSLGDVFLFAFLRSLFIPVTSKEWTPSFPSTSL